VARRDGYAVELAEVVGGGFGYAVGMEPGLVEAAGGGFGRALAGGGYPGCIASLRASVAPC
jgi:hypothetical protein